MAATVRGVLASVVCIDVEPGGATRAEVCADVLRWAMAEQGVGLAELLARTPEHPGGARQSPPAWVRRGGSEEGLERRVRWSVVGGLKRR